MTMAGGQGGSEPSPRESLWMRRQRGPQILTVLALTNLVAYAVRNALFGVYPDLRAEFHVSDQALGLLTTAFLVPHAIATLPFGWAGDRYDRRRVIAFGLVLAAIASALGALASNMTELAVSRAAVGFGTAAVVPVANSILGQLYEGPHKASRIALFNLGLLFGGLLGFGAGLAVGFPAVVVVLAVPTLILALIVLVLPTPAHPAQRDAMPLWRYTLKLGRLFIVGGRSLLRIRTLRWLIVSSTAMAFAAGGFNAWLLDFLQRDKGMSKGDATTVLSIAMVGAVAGIIVGGRISDRLRTKYVAGRLWTIVIGMTLAIPCTIISLEAGSGAVLVIAGTANFFFFSWYHAPIAASVDDLAPPAQAVAAQGLVIFMMHLVGTSSSSYVVGLVSDYTSLYRAMWVPTGALILAAITMVVATSSFAGDHLRARAAGGSSPRMG